MQGSHMLTFNVEPNFFIARHASLRGSYSYRVSQVQYVIVVSFMTFYLSDSFDVTIVS